MIKVNQEKCIGCGLCASTCEKIFKINDETNKAEVISQEVGECNLEQAITDCPVEAISNE